MTTSTSHKVPAVYVRTRAELDAAMARTSAAELLAIDTEFLRESTYYPKLCLVQVATEEICVLIDPLALGELSALAEFLCDRSRIKVLHAARQDLEVLRLATGRVPGPIFDTQVAAGLSGLPPQIGYAELVARLLGHTLDKNHTRTDWSRRPLADEQLAYAADDVRYLVPLHAVLAERLQRTGRQDWLRDECRALEDPDLYQMRPEDAWRRLRGLQRLEPRQRAVAARLAEWRERLAIALDRPRGWILADEALRAIAQRLPRTPEELSRIQGLPQAVLRKRTADLLEQVSEGLSAPATAATQYDASASRPDAAQVARVSQLMQFLRDEAHRLEVSPELLATRRDIERLVYGGEPGSLLAGWRRGVIGEKLAAMARNP